MACPGGQVEHGRSPVRAGVSRTDSLLEGQTGAVGEQGRTLDPIAYDVEAAGSDVALHQVGVASRAETGIEGVGLLGEGDAPEVDGVEPGTVPINFEVLELGDPRSVLHSEQRSAGGEGAVGIGVAGHEHRGGPVAAVGGDPGPTDHPGQGLAPDLLVVGVEEDCLIGGEEVALVVEAETPPAGHVEPEAGKAGCCAGATEATKRDMAVAVVRRARPLVRTERGTAAEVRAMSTPSVAAYAEERTGHHQAAIPPAAQQLSGGPGDHAPSCTTRPPFGAEPVLEGDVPLRGGPAVAGARPRVGERLAGHRQEVPVVTVVAQGEL